MRSSARPTPPSLPDEAAPYPHGTSVRFVTEIPAASIATALRAAALHCPIPVLLNGDTLERKAFLDGAVHAEPWNGIVFGVFRHHTAGYREPDINFHGLTIEARLPTVDTIDDGVWAVRADIANAPDLELVLPARKELVETPFAADMRDAARHAIYRAMRRADRTPALAYDEYSRARKAGIDMPIAPAVLRPWRPAIADVNDWRDSPKPEPVRPGTIVMAADPDPQDAQALWRAATRAGMQHRLFQADSRYDGYPWYDSLAHATDLQFTIARGAVNHPLSVLRGIDTDDVPVIDPGHPESFARPDSIEIALRSRPPQRPRRDHRDPGRRRVHRGSVVVFRGRPPARHRRHRPRAPRARGPHPRLLFLPVRRRLGRQLGNPAGPLPRRCNAHRGQAPRLGRRGPQAHHRAGRLARHRLGAPQGPDRLHHRQADRKVSVDFVPGSPPANRCPA